MSKAQLRALFIIYKIHKVIKNYYFLINTLLQFCEQIEQRSKT